jgi:hypothetical protein
MKTTLSFAQLYPDVEREIEDRLQLGTNNLVNQTKEKAVAADIQNDNDMHDKERAKRDMMNPLGNHGGKMRSQRKMHKKSSKRKTHKKKIQRRIKSKSQRRRR